MCIIIYKKKEVEMPSTEVMRYCFLTNPHGAGIIVRGTNRSWLIHKGFMSFDDLNDFLLSAPCDINKVELAIHFRLATHGEINRKQTHPFPVTGSFEEMEETTQVCSKAIMHNGILHGFFEDIHNGHSDSMNYVKYLHDTEAYKTIEKDTEGSRIILFRERGVDMYGNWILDSDTGLYYSNSGYLNAKKGPSRPYYWEKCPASYYKKSRMEY